VEIIQQLALEESAAADEARKANEPQPRKAASFADQLARSLVAVNDTRAWFDEARGYTQVRQSRVPTRLPQVSGAGEGEGLCFKAGCAPCNNTGQ
jgi:hypothetical protein